MNWQPTEEENKKLAEIAGYEDKGDLWFALWNPIKDLNQCFEVLEGFCKAYHYRYTYYHQHNRTTIEEAILKAVLEASKEETT